MTSFIYRSASVSLFHSVKVTPSFSLDTSRKSIPPSSLLRKVNNLNLYTIKAFKSNGNSKSKLPTALKFKARKGGNRSDIPGKDEWSVVGYSAGENLDLLGLLEGLENQLIYTRTPLSPDLDSECLFVTNSYNVEPTEQRKEIFFFKAGCVVFWNVPELERHAVLRFIKDFHDESYEEDMVFEESELMKYSLSETSNSHLNHGVIQLTPDCSSLVRYSFSNAIASSVKLGAWEASLDRIIDSIEFIHEDLRRLGSIRVDGGELLRKTGEILALRHLINLSSDLLDTPDFYWDREGLEQLYNTTCAHLAVRKRTSVVNEKISHCLELLEIIKTQMSNDQGHKLEKIIIILIAIEIGFEVMHYARSS